MSRLLHALQASLLLLLLLLSLSSRQVSAFAPQSPRTAVPLRVATTSFRTTTSKTPPLFQHRATTTRSSRLSASSSSSSSSSSISGNNPALALYERFQDNLPSSKLIDACDGQSNVIASDMATKAGLSLAQTKRELTLLASLSQGDIAVSLEGDLLYSFPTNLKGVLRGQSKQYAALQSFQTVWPRLFWGIRVSFGVALVASLVAIYSTIFFIQNSSQSDNDNRRSDDRRGGGGMGGFGSFGYFWGPSPFDFFYYRPYGGYGYYGTASEQQRRDPETLGFFESVYSFVFGDGDPNTSLEARRIQLAAQMIRENKGAVTAEQLAPFSDPESTPEQAMKSNFVDESFVLPIVTQLNGEPTVTEDGDIVYLFPELQTTADSGSTTSLSSRRSQQSASNNAMILKRAGLAPNADAREMQQMLNYNGISTKGAYEKDDLLRLLEKALPPLTADEAASLQQDADVDDPSLLAEREIPFSVATDFNKLLAAGLGVLNLGGALYLGSQLTQITAAGYALPGIYGTIAGFYPLLLGYGILFNAIPAIRNVVLKRKNAQIQARNGVRKQWQRALTNGGGKIQTKLQAAKKMALQQTRLGSNDMVYDTAKTTVEELGQQKEQSAMSDFDKLLDNSEDSSKKSATKLLKEDNSETFDVSSSSSSSKKPATQSIDDDGGAFQ